MREMICIVCPTGCRLSVTDDGGPVVTGNSCPRGAEYAINEILSPVRVITSTVRINGAAHRRCPVKTDSAIPKGMIFDAMSLLNEVELNCPIRAGQVAVADVCGTGANFVATRDM